MGTDVTEAKRSVLHQLPFDGQGPLLHAVVGPIVGVESEEGLRSGRNRLDTVDVHSGTGKAIGRRRSVEQIVIGDGTVVVGDAIHKTEIERWIAAGGLQNLRQ